MASGRIGAMESSTLILHETAVPAFVRLPRGGIIHNLISDWPKTLAQIRTLDLNDQRVSVDGTFPGHGEFYFLPGVPVQAEKASPRKFRFFQSSWEGNRLELKEIVYRVAESGALNQIGLYEYQIDAQNSKNLVSRKIRFGIEFEFPGGPGNIKDERTRIVDGKKDSIVYSSKEHQHPSVNGHLLMFVEPAGYLKDMMEQFPFDASIFDLRDNHALLESHALAFRPETVESTFWGRILPSAEITNKRGKRLSFKKGIGYDENKKIDGDFYFEELALHDFGLDFGPDKGSQSHPIIVLRKKRFMDGHEETEIDVGAYCKSAVAKKYGHSGAFARYGNDGRLTPPDFKNGYGEIDEGGAFDYRGHLPVGSLPKRIDISKTEQIFLEQVRQRDFSNPQLATLSDV